MLAELRDNDEPKPACLYISRYAPERSPTDPYFGLPRFLAERCRLTGIWGRPRREIPFAATCEAIVHVGASPRDLPRAIFHAIKVIRARQPDFIVCCVEDFALALGWMASRFTGRPYFVVAEDPPFTQRYAANPGLYRRLERGLRRWLLSRLLHASSGIFCFIDRQALVEFLTGKCRVVQLRTGVSEEAFEWIQKHRPLPREGNVNWLDYTIGYVGAIDGEQGMLELLQAVSLVRLSVPNVRVRLIGPVDAIWHQEFESALEQLDLREVVEVTGWVAYEEMLQRLITCDVCCYLRRPSPWADAAYPLKICEYLACERPIVSWDYPGCRAMLADGQFGRLIPAGDVQGLAETLIALATRAARQDVEMAIRKNMASLLAKVSYEKALIGMNTVEHPIPASER